MVDPLSLLSQAASSLSAHNASVATASHNLQNANTPGFSRQRADLAAVSPADMVVGGYLGRGVALSAVTQARDRFLEAQLPAAFGQAAAASAESNALHSVTALNPDGPGSLTEALAGFYSSLRALAQNPGDPSLRRGAVVGTRNLTLAFNRTAQGIESARTGLDAQIQSTVSHINTLSQQLTDLNYQIRLASGSGASPNDLLDSRQRVQDKLAQLTGASVVLSDGDVGLALGGGVALVSGLRAATLSTAADPANGGHVSVQLTRADGSGPVALTGGVGGELGGLLAARDGALRSAADRVDALAFDLATEVNNSHQLGFGLDGNNGRDLFDTGGAVVATGVAARLVVNAPILADPSLLATASAAGTLPGDSTNLLATIATESATLSNGLDASGSLRTAISEFGASAETAKATADHDQALLTQLSGMRESVSGVSIDEEMMNLTRAQRAFEAVSKVIATASEMLELLMKIK